MRRSALAFLLLASPLYALVVTEIMYNPPGPGEELEWIELYNEKAAPEDLSGYRFTHGIHFTFPTGWRPDGKPLAALGPGEYLVLASDAQAFQARYGFAPFGEFQGHLDNGGDRIVLENDAGDPHIYIPPEERDPNGPDELRREGPHMIDFRYKDSGRWPAAADGTGHTLALLDVFEDQGDPDNWTCSPTMWGTPGASNGLQDEWTETEIFPSHSTWKYIKGTAEPPASWKNRTFDDGAWSTGEAPIGYGEPDIVTDLDDMRGNYRSFYARKEFEIPNPASVDDLVLYVNSDDGFVAYLNGVEVARYNVTGNPPAHDDLANGAGEPTGLVAYDISAYKSNLVAGTNVIAIQTHNGNDTSSDAYMDGRLVVRSLIPSGAGGFPLVINELFYQTTAQRFVEIHNRSSNAVSLEGLYLSSDPDDLTAHPLSGTIPERGFLSVPESDDLPLELTFPAQPSPDDPGTLRVFLTYVDPGDPSRKFVVAAESVSGEVPQDWSMGRIPDGSEKWYRLSRPSPGAGNRLSEGDVNTDIVINEIMYHPFREDDPYDDGDNALYGKNLEFLELYNRGTSPVDLTGWRFTRGISYVFDGVVMTPGQYLVLAKDPARIEQVYGLPAGTVLGPYGGTLANGGEKIRLRDQNNNVADEVRYYDAGRWDKWADGLGSSLELIDPDQDNSFPSAWKASDDSDKSQWTTVSYSGVHNEFWNGENEFHVYLCGKGEILFDELQFSENSNFSTNRIRGGSFDRESDYTDYWIKSDDTGGNHVDTHWTDEDSFSGPGCLKIVASGRGDSGFNRLECDTTVGLSRRTYYVRYRARWLRGYNLIMTRTHGHGVARSSPIAVPERLGSPGAVNTVYRENIGPVYRDLDQDPAAPGANQPVTVTCRIADSDGVSSAVIHYRLDTSSTYSQSPMNDDGTGEDETAGDGIWTGVIPGQPDDSVVEFYVEATDGAGNVTQFPPLPPADAPPTVLKNLAIYRVGDKVSPGRRPVYRITLTRDGENALNTRRTLSNHLVPCSFVLNEKKIFYNCGQRFRGSPFIRRGGVGGYAWSGIRVRFPADQPLFGNIVEINLDGSGQSNQHDRTAYYFERKLVAATPGVYTSWSWGRYVDMRYKAGGHERTGLYDHIQKIDADYVSYWWRGHDAGTLHKVDDWFEFRDDGGFSNRQASMTYHSPNKEDHYRQNFKLRSREKADEFQPLIDLTFALTNWPADRIDSELEEIMDVRQWSAILCARLFIDDWDTLGARRGKNSYLYLPSPCPAPSSGGETDPECTMIKWDRWQLVPWDSDLTFGNQSAQIYPEGVMPQLQKLFARPWVRRMINSDYRYLIDEIVDRPGGGTRLSAWLQWVSSSAGVGGTDLAGWCLGRAENVLSRLPSDDRYPFDILSPRGNPFATTEASVLIEGQAPSLVDTITLEGEAIDDEITWNDAAEWEYGPLTLQEGLNEFHFAAYRRNGELVAEKILRILRSDEEPPQITSLVPSEGITLGGETVRILGSNFAPNAEVKLDGTEISDAVWVSVGEIRFVTPPHTAGDVTVSVINPSESFPDGVPGFYEYFTYIPIPAPEIALLIPDRGYRDGGTRVQIRGKYFQEGVRVFFGGTEAAEVTYLGLGEIEVTAPPHAVGTADVRVLNVDSQEDTLPDGFTYLPDRAPVLTDVSPSEGPTGGGTLVTVEGVGFKSGAMVWIGGKPASSVQFVSAGELRCYTPPADPGETFVSVRVENPDGQYAWRPSGFRYVNGVVSCERGDANGDGRINIADAAAVLGRLFRNDDAVRCEGAADFNRDGRIDIADAISIFAYLFP